MFPSSDDKVDDENEGERTIQDDVVVASQDVAAGFIRMGILPRICYLLEVTVKSSPMFFYFMFKCPEAYMLLGALVCFIFF